MTRVDRNAPRTTARSSGEVTPRPPAPASSTPGRATTDGSAVDANAYGEARRTLGDDQPAGRPDLTTGDGSRPDSRLGLLRTRRELDQPTAASGNRGEERFNPFEHEFGRTLLDSVTALGPGKLPGVEPLQIADRVKDGNVVVEIPLKAGKYKAKGINYKVEPNTTMRVQMQVRDGKLVPARDARGRDTGGGCKVDIRPPLDLPLWVTGRGAYLRERGEAQAQFKAELGGFFDLNIGKQGTFELKDALGAFGDGRASSVSAAGNSRNNRNAETSPLASGMVQFDQMKFAVGDVTLKAGGLDAGSVKLDLADGNRLQLTGDLNSAVLQGQVRTNAIALNQDGFALTTGPGTADLVARYQRQPDGSLAVKAQVSNLNATADGIEAKQEVGGGRPPDRISLGRTALRNGSFDVDFTLRKDPASGALSVGSTKTRTHLEIDGQLNGAKLTVADARDDAELRAGPTRLQGTIELNDRTFKLDASASNMKFEVADLQAAEGSAGLDVHHLRAQGDAKLSIDTGRKQYDIEAQARNIDLRIDDYRGSARGTAVDMGRTDISGAGKVKVSLANHEVDIEGNLRVKGSIDDVKVQTGDGKTALDLAKGSTIDATLHKLSAARGQPFVLETSGQVDLGLENYSTQLPGVSASGTARVAGRTDLKIGPGQVLLSNSDASISVNVDDGQVAPGGQGFNLDLARGSKLDLKVKEARFSSTAPASVTLGAGSKLDAVLDRGQITIGRSVVELEPGSQAHFAIDSLRTGASGPELKGKLSVDAKLDASRLDGHALSSNPNLRIEGPTGARAKTRVTVDDVTLRQDGTFALSGVGLKVDAHVDRVASTLPAPPTTVPGDGALPIEPPYALPQAPRVGPETSPAGTIAASDVSRLSAASIAGASAASAAHFDPVDVARRLENGTLEFEIPVAGKLGSGYWKSADFARGTKLSVTARVENGKLVPGEVKAKFSSSGDGPLWVTARGAYIDSDNTLRLDLGGMRDFAVKGMEKMPTDVAGFVDRLTGRSTTGAGGGGRSGAGSGASTGSAASSGDAQLKAFKFPDARIEIRDAQFKSGTLPLPGGNVDVKPGTKFSLSGTMQKATLTGRVDFNALELAQDGVALKAGAGSADLRVDYSSRGDRAEVTTALDNLSLDLQYAVTKRANGDYIHLARGTTSGASFHGTTNLHLNELGLPDRIDAGEGKLDVPRFNGQIEGARVTVPDADGTAQIEIGRSAVEGEIRADKQRILVRGKVAQLDATLHDFQVKSDTAAADIDYARIKGSGRVDFGSDSGLTIDAKVSAVDVRGREFKGAGRGFSVDTVTTYLTGQGQLKFQSNGELAVTGDLHLDSALTSGGFDGKAIGVPGQMQVAGGSRVVADVNEFRFNKDGRLVVRGKGGIDFRLDNFDGGIGPVRAEGVARLYGGGEFALDTEKGVTLPPQMALDVDVRDGAIESSDGKVKLDFARGSKVSFRVTALNLSETGELQKFELGRGTHLVGTLDRGTIALPGLNQPLTLGAGSAVDFAIDKLVAERAGASSVQGRLKLDATVDMRQIDLNALARLRGVQIERIDDVTGKLRLDIERVRLGNNGSFALDDADISIDARLGAVTGSYRPQR